MRPPEPPAHSKMGVFYLPERESPINRLYQKYDPKRPGQKGQKYGVYGAPAWVLIDVALILLANVGINDAIVAIVSIAIMSSTMTHCWSFAAWCN